MDHQGSTKSQSHVKPYRRLTIMITLSFVSMYTLMYAMVDRIDNVYPNFNQFYMAGLMTAPMLLIEILLMKDMYPKRNLNLLLLASGLVIAVTAFSLIRRQAAIGDAQFLKSMIPHHASAILMCKQASIDAPEIKQLCQAIISGQQSEIDQMKAMLARP